MNIIVINLYRDGMSVREIWECLHGLLQYHEIMDILIDACMI